MESKISEANSHEKKFSSSAYDFVIMVISSLRIAFNTLI